MTMTNSHLRITPHSRPQSGPQGASRPMPTCSTRIAPDGLAWGHSRETVGGLPVVGRDRIRRMAQAAPAVSLGCANTLPKATALCLSTMQRACPVTAPTLPLPRIVSRFGGGRSTVDDGMPDTVTDCRYAVSTVDRVVHVSAAKKEDCRQQALTTG